MPSVASLVWEFSLKWKAFSCFIATIISCVALSFFSIERGASLPCILPPLKEVVVGGSFDKFAKLWSLWSCSLFYSFVGIFDINLENRFLFLSFWFWHWKQRSPRRWYSFTFGVNKYAIKPKGTNILNAPRKIDYRQYRILSSVKVINFITIQKW